MDLLPDDRRLVRKACLPCALQRRRCEPGPDGTHSPCLRCFKQSRSCVGQEAGDSVETTRQRRQAVKPTRKKRRAGSNSGDSGDLDAGQLNDDKGQDRERGCTDLSVASSSSSQLALSVSPAPTLPVSPSSISNCDFSLLDENMVFAGLRGWWDRQHPIAPLLHRPSFEAAFTSLDSPCPHYGGPPMALMFAVAANGIMYADVSGLVLSETQRTLLSMGYLEFARDALVAGFFSRDSQPLMTDLEALQTIYLIMWRCLPEGKALDAFLALERCRDVFHRTCFDPVSGQPVGSWNSDCTTHVEWIENEMRNRLFLMLSHIDTSYAYYTGRRTLFDYLQFRTPLPCSELYFDMSSPEHAFDLLSRTRVGQTFAEPPDLSCLFSEDDFATDGRDRFQRSVETIRPIISSVFSRRASHLAVAHVGGALRSLRTSMRNQLATNGINLLKLASQPTELDSPGESHYRSRAHFYNALVDEIVKCVPEDVVKPLERGDPVPFLSLAACFLPSPAAGHILLGYLMILKGSTMEHWLEDSLSPVPGSSSDSPIINLFASQSPALASLLESSVLVSSWMNGQLQVDPELKFPILGNVVSGLRIAKMGTAVASLLRSSSSRTELLEITERDVRTAVRYLEIASTQASGAGRMVVDDLKRQVVEAGISLEGLRGPREVEKLNGWTPVVLNLPAVEGVVEKGESSWETGTMGSGSPRGRVAGSGIGVDRAMAELL